MEVLSIQYLRGIAALMVVLHHLLLQLQRMGYAGYWPTFLPSGVDIFFVISGFIMWTTTANGMRPLEFYRRRLVRIVPLYWVMTSLVLLVLLAYPSAVQSGRLDALHVIASYVFFPALNPAQGDMSPLLIPGWSLNYEMFFYLIFGVTLLMGTRRRFAVVVTVLTALAVIPLLVNVPPQSAFGFYTSDIILEFALGVALGWLYGQGFAFSQAVAWSCLVLGTIVLATSDPNMNPRGLLVGVPALAITAGAVMIERTGRVPRLASLHLLGNASYSLYLSHPIILSAAGQGWRKLPTSAFAEPTLVFGIAAFACALTAGYLVHVLAEKPLLRIAGSRTLPTPGRRDRTADAAVPPSHEQNGLVLVAQADKRNAHVDAATPGLGADEGFAPRARRRVQKMGL